MFALLGRVRLGGRGAVGVPGKSSDPSVQAELFVFSIVAFLIFLCVLLRIQRRPACSACFSEAVGEAAMQLHVAIDPYARASAFSPWESAQFVEERTFMGHTWERRHG